MMNLGHWRLLAAVADLRNISRAAEQVGLSQSAASQAIAQMEASLGAPLLVREKREVSLTAFGEQVMRHARTMLSEFDAIRALGDAARGLQAGRIRLATFPSVLATVLPGLLAAFRRRHPGIDVVALEGTDEEVEAWLAADTIELGVVLNPAPQREAVIIGRDAWVALLPAQHALGRRSSEQGVTWQELADQPFVLATGGCDVHAQRLAQQAGVTLADIRVTVRDLASAAVLVREGLGVSVIPESALPQDQRGLRMMQLQPRLYREFGLVCSRAGRASPAVQAFLREL
ncbi:DNA-binding transcriptional LysR family regulator [Duganella sp. 1224]|uniref:LysR family transcriptional regulator n=1 Tax=Duganella sp. 1224 TaxID=2587052 RepID=UPI0015CC5BBD|nr:LysR family transcriptional regulator [Duganella sp. 1224]NYE59800.1 DNA-binding transcriptional LysR family regulator [Duganella sp. 1224]